MSPLPALTDLYEASRTATWEGGRRVDVHLDIERSVLDWTTPTTHGLIVLELMDTQNPSTLTVRGDSENLRRVLRNVLIMDGVLRSCPQEHHELGQFRLSSSSTAATLAIVREWIDRIVEGVTIVEAIEQGRADTSTHVLRGFWWDRKANFGDAVGPWLAAKLTQKPVVNVRATKDNPVPREGRAIALVGSIIHMINRPDVDIWGAGLMRPLSEKSLLRNLTGVRVHAVRGHLTRHELRTKLDWDVPEVLGDPALLLSRHYTANLEPAGSSKIAFVPHMSHRPSFKNINNDVLDVVDVREDLRIVVDKIASAKACVSTSLHGLIVAQSYGVPWVWLNITDAELGGGDFKFNDFFSTLEGEVPASMKVSRNDLAELDILEVARQARLPDLAIDLTRLEEAFPGISPGTPIKPPKSSILRKIKAYFPRG